ncbi:MAG: hypothetical protein HY898_11775 [Deltaproteobacteria bacterium]|nr:hypothetical protein [Deltaproteobacteria bacterium]
MESTKAQNMAAGTARADSSATAAVIAFRQMKTKAMEQVTSSSTPDPEWLERHALYEALEWLAESVGELHAKVDRLAGQGPPGVGAQRSP